MTAMNALLHGFDYSPIVRRDTIGGSEDKWDEVQFDFILENPPFSGAAQSPKRSLRVEKGEKYVLFLAAALRSLRPGGRAGIVLPNGILFGDTNAHIEVKKRLLAECDLQAVVTLPKGMFEPYTPNQTCFLDFPEDRQAHQGNSGFQRAKATAHRSKRRASSARNSATTFPTCSENGRSAKPPTASRGACPPKQIIANGYNLTLASLGLVEPEKTDHAEPEDILASRGGKGTADSGNRRRDARTRGGGEGMIATKAKAGVATLRVRSKCRCAPLDRCGRVLGGGTPSKSNAEYWNGTIPWVTAKEMWTGEIR